MRRRGLVGVVAAVTGVAAAGLGAGIAVRRTPARGVGSTDLTGAGHRLAGEERAVRAEDGVPLVTVAGGDLAAPLTVVFVHGYCLDMRCWHLQWKRIGRRARVVAYDQRSHGRSGRRPAGRDLIDQLGRDLLAVLDATAPGGPVVLVGHSMGGMTVLALADAHPELFGDRVVGVALLATSAGRLGNATFGLPVGGSALARRLVPWAVPRLGRQSALVDRSRAATHPELVRLLLRYFSFGSEVEPALVDLVGDMIGGTPFEVIADFFPAFAGHDKVAALGTLRRVETLVLVGDGDLVTPPDHSRRIAAELPGAELTVIPRAGHLVMLEHPNQVTDRLAALLDRLPAS